MHREVLTAVLPVVQSCILGPHWEMKGTRDFPGRCGQRQQLPELILGGAAVVAAALTVISPWGSPSIKHANINSVIYPRILCIRIWGFVCNTSLIVVMRALKESSRHTLAVTKMKRFV